MGALDLLNGFAGITTRGDLDGRKTAELAAIPYSSLPLGFASRMEKCWPVPPSRMVRTNRQAPRETPRSSSKQFPKTSAPDPRQGQAVLLLRAEATEPTRLRLTTP
jgi:hypothetical protein